VKAVRINETYSAFVQGFMPMLARPEVDADLVAARSTLTGEYLAEYVGT